MQRAVWATVSSAASGFGLPVTFKLATGNQTAASDSPQNPTHEDEGESINGHDQGDQNQIAESE